MRPTLFCAALVVAPMGARANETPPAAPASASPTATEAAAPDPEAATTAETNHGAHAHHLAVFAGATATSHETAPSVGLDYLFSLPVLERRIGLGPIFEATFASHLELVAGLLVAAKGPIGLQLAAGPIVLLVEDEKLWGGRVNLAYGFHVGERWSVGPSVSADFLSEANAYVLGVSGGLGF